MLSVSVGIKCKERTLNESLRKEHRKKKQSILDMTHLKTSKTSQAKDV